MATAVRSETRKHEAHAEQRVLLRGVSWQTYKALGEDLERANSKVRLTYDRGSLEILTLGREHEVDADRLSRIVDILAEELDLPLDAGGSTTHQRDDLEKGFEPDRCFYIRNEPRMRGKMKLELPEDPPPDLTIEVDISSTSLNRMGIFAAIGIPEVWRFDGDQFSVHLLQANGEYTPSSSSLSFPALPVAEVNHFLHLIPTMELRRWSAAIRAWVREHVIPRARAEGYAEP
jgi:Uma2 family endonuclease